MFFEVKKKTSNKQFKIASKILGDSKNIIIFAVY